MRAAASLLSGAEALRATCAVCAQLPRAAGASLPLTALACGGTAAAAPAVGTAVAAALSWSPWQAVRGFVTAPAPQAAAGTPEDVIAPEIGLARIDGLDDTGFLVNDVQVEGAIMVSGDVFTLWRVQRFQDITLDSLAMLQALKPVPDLLILGCGRTVRRLPADLARQLHEMGVRVDALDTNSAASTFNLLNQEGRKVMGALLPLGTAE